MFKKGDKAKVKASQEDLDFIGVWDSIKDGDIVTIEGQEENALWNNPKFDNNGYCDIIIEYKMPQEGFEPSLSSLEGCQLCQLVYWGMNHVNEGSVLPVHPLIFFVYFDFSSPPFVVAFIFW